MLEMFFKTKAEYLFQDSISGIHVQFVGSSS